MFCTGCGHLLGAGRFCTHCGQPVDADAAPEATAERPAVPPPPSGPPQPPGPPPPAYTQPPAPRYPLFRDEVRSDPPVAPPTAPAPSPTSQPPRRPAPQWLPWALTVVVVALIAVIGGMLLVSGGDDDPAADPVSADEATPSDEAAGPTPTTPTVIPPPADGPQDIARFAAATVPKTAKPNQDTKGNMVRYDASNMLDGVPESCWRMSGDGSGQSITFTLPEPTQISEVGLINGYAKQADRFDWYAGNRRILDVEWVFDDGTVVPQALTETPQMQTVPVDPVTTSSVVLRLVTVTAPGQGPSARDNTAISDVRLVGEPGS